MIWKQIMRRERLRRGMIWKQIRKPGNLRRVEIGLETNPRGRIENKSCHGNQKKDKIEIDLTKISRRKKAPYEKAKENCDDTGSWIGG